MADWDKAIFELSDVRVILHLKEHHTSRYSELLSQVLQSRSTLARSLDDLQRMKLVSRQVMNTRPVQTQYVLTEKGVRVADLLLAVKREI